MDTDQARGRDPDEGASSVDDFGMFYERTCVATLRFCQQRTHDAQLAADLTAETYCAALLSVHSFDARRGPAEAWLMGVAKNQLRRFLRTGRTAKRARRRIGIPSIPLDDVSMARVEELVDLEALKPRLRSAMQGLPRGQAAAVRMRVMEERGYDEIARDLGCSRAAARVRVSRGLSRLADEMREVDDT